MKVFIDDYQNIINKEPLTITIGNFDGVHLGHQILIEKVKSFKDTKTGILTFDPHPMKFLRDVRFEKLMSVDQKIEVLKTFHLDYGFFVNFTTEFSNLSVLEFIHFLKEINVKRIVIGKDFKFGAYAKGSVSDLIKHFEVIIVDDILKSHTRVSTTYIKDLLTTGNLSKAKEMLTRDYAIEGVVIHGDKVGRTLGMPTANLDINDYVLPLNGVYYVHVDYNDKVYAGALNIGYNPTVNYSVTKRTEVHILNFNETIYGKTLKLIFKSYIRPELKFDNKETLIETMQNDIKTCEKLFQNE